MDLIIDENILSWRASERVGTMLRGKWRLDRLLGVGGMAAVYEGTHRNGKRGAVKVLHLELSMYPEARSRFLQEGYMANRVDHPGAVSVLDDDVAEDGSVFLVMELLEGQTLESLASDAPSNRIDPPTVLAIVDQLLEVLAAAHDKGVVHRDIKPENLFLTREGRVKVLDFGLARMRELRQGQARMTKNGSPMGTPAFLPPEQAQGHWDKVDARADLWAVGATMYTLLTGRLVHDTTNVNQLLLAAMTQPAKSIRQAAPELPKAVVALVDRALAFEQKDRWPDARAMLRATREARQALPAVDLAVILGQPFLPPGERAVEQLQGAGGTLIGSTTSHTHNTSIWKRPRSHAPFALAGVAMGALAVVIGVVALRAPAPPSEASPAAGGPIQAPGAAPAENANVQTQTQTLPLPQTQTQAQTQAPLAPAAPSPGGSPSAAPGAPVVEEPAISEGSPRPKAPPATTSSSKPRTTPKKVSDPLLGTQDF